MSHTAVRRAVVLVLAAAAIIGGPVPGNAGRGTPSASRPGAAAGPQQPGTLPSTTDQSPSAPISCSTKLFEGSPPAVGRVFKLNPSLFEQSTAGLLAPYPSW